MEQSYNGSDKKTCETMDAGIVNICPLDRCFAGEILAMWNRSFDVLYHISKEMLDEMSTLKFVVAMTMYQVLGWEGSDGCKSSLLRPDEGHMFLVKQTCLWQVVEPPA